MKFHFFRKIIGFKFIKLLKRKKSLVNKWLEDKLSDVNTVTKLTLSQHKTEERDPQGERVSSAQELNLLDKL